MLTALIPAGVARFRPSVPLPLTAVTGTTQVRPPSPLVGVPIVPVPSLPVRAKLPAATPATAALKLTVKLSLLALVSAAAPPRLMDSTVGPVTAVIVRSCRKLLPPASVTCTATCSAPASRLLPPTLSVLLVSTNLPLSALAAPSATRA